jgi:hypothetical protein
MFNPLSSLTLGNYQLTAAFNSCQPIVCKNRHSPDKIPSVAEYMKKSLPGKGQNENFFGCSFEFTHDEVTWVNPRKQHAIR